MTDKKPTALDELREFWGDDAGDLMERAVKEMVQRERASRPAPGTEDHDDAVLNALQDGRHHDARQLAGKHR